MPKSEKFIERSHEKDFSKAKEFFSGRNYKRAEPLLLKCYYYYKDKNQLKKAYEAIEKYIIILMTFGRNQKVLPKVNELLEYSIKTKNKKFEALAYGLKGIIYKNNGAFDKSIEFTKKAKRLFNELNNFDDLAKTYGNIGNTYYFKGNYGRSLKNYKKSEKICIENNILKSLAGIYQVISFCYLALNNLEKFREYYKIIFEYLKYVNDIQNRVEILNNLSIPPFYSDEIGETMSHLLLKLLEDCDEHNLTNQKAKTLRNLAGFSKKAGKYDEARKYLKQALDISKGLNYELDKAYIYNNLGQLFYKEGKLEDVIKAMTKSKDLSNKYGIVPLIIDGHIFLGKVYKKLNAFDKSYRHYREALDHYQRISNDISSVEQKEEFRRSYQHLPEIIEELNKLIESKDVKIELEELFSIQNISKEICSTANKQFNNFIRKDCEQGFINQDILIDELMQEQLENDARKLFRRKNKYVIKDSGKEIDLKPKEIDLLYEKKCLTNKSSKTTEIDIFGEWNSMHQYILGECTFKNQRKIISKIKCFFTKVNIIADHLIAQCERLYQSQPTFHLVIVSMKGFPKNEVKKRLEVDHLNIFGKIVDIEYIDFELFKKLLKENDIKIAKYEKYWNRIKPMGNSIEKS